MIDSAIAIAASQHAGQVDKLGVPYICHVMSVWARVRDDGLDEIHQAVALLHDVCEDTPFGLGDVRHTFGDEIADAVDAITKRNGETRDAYMDRVCANPIAAKVKWHDSWDNWSRINELPDVQTRGRLRKKYNAVFDRILAGRDGHVEWLG